MQPVTIALSQKASSYRNYPSLVPAGFLPKKRKSSVEQDSEGSVDSAGPLPKRFFLGVEDLSMMGRDKVELGSPNKSPPEVRASYSVLVLIFGI